MIDVAGLLTSLVALLAVLCRLWSGGGLSGSGGSRGGLVVGFAASMGTSAALLAPATVAAAADWPPLWRALPLLGTESRLIAVACLAAMAYDIRGGGATRPQLALLAGLLTFEAGCYLASGASQAGSVLIAHGPAGRAALVAYDGAFVSYTLWCVGLFTLVVRRSARQVPPGLLRTGLRLVAAGGTSGLLWALAELIQLSGLVMTGRQNTAEDVLSAPLAVLTLTLGLGGATLTAWGRQAAAPVRWLRAWHSYRRLGPLWAALHAVRPEIALDGEASPWGRSVQFALYRRVIEIRDGQLALRSYVHPRAVEWAGGEARSAEVEAAVIAAAVEAATAGHRFPGAGYRAPEVRAELAEETARLLLIAAAFTGSTAVAEVRRRVRAELRS
ncbi:MAB_1171c family putative transporter [Kitasatospora sp. McL0602]|uniref:MAB_1171c family putative transporter n=1 Tax=Kitasatospora sp. McL0602 TaxID=3439530 RepID=UPI003F89C008